MSNSEMVKAPPSEVQHDTSLILAGIARAAMDPAVDVAKLERLLAIQEKLLADQRKTAYATAMARLQEKLPQITKAGVILNKDGTTVRNHFAKLEDIDTQIRPICAEEGFSFSVDTEAGHGGTKYTLTISHRDGHSEARSIVLPLDAHPARSAAQNVGSTLSYARRYMLMMALNIVTRDIDNDGAGESEPITAEQASALRAGLAEAGGNEARFLNWIAAKSFEEIPVANYARAAKFIEDKKRQKVMP